MKTLFVLGVLCLPYFARPQEETKNQQNHQGIAWIRDGDWTEIKEKAKKENKYIFLDCYATWCGPCKEMDMEVYTNPRIGNLMNERFINLKVQMDTSKKDDEQIQRWYLDAHALMIEYSVNSFPSFLFFSPDGKLIHQDMGARNVASFISLIETALDPRKPIYYSKYEEYKKGKKDYSDLRELALFTRSPIADDSLATMMAEDYKKNVLGRLDSKTLLSKQNVEFLFEFSDLITSKDDFFCIAYKRPTVLDSIIGQKGRAWALVHKIVSKEELANKILDKGKATKRMPNWDKLMQTVTTKYPLLDAKKLILEYQILYYRSLYIDWRLWAQYKDEFIRLYPLKPPFGLSVYIQINGHGGAWHAFLNCSDTLVLKKAVEWADFAVQLDGDQIDHRASYYDTKANLLYKLGHKQEAIALQKKAVDLLIHYNPEVKDLEIAYAQMLDGQPTYINEGAVWDKGSLARISNN